MHCFGSWESCFNDLESRDHVTMPSQLDAEIAAELAVREQQTEAAWREQQQQRPNTGGTTPRVKPRKQSHQQRMAMKFAQKQSRRGNGAASLNMSAGAHVRCAHVLADSAAI